MSIQDDIFDVRDALKGKPEFKSFERIEAAFYATEEAYEEASGAVKAIRQGLRAAKSLLEEKK